MLTQENSQLFYTTEYAIFERLVMTVYHQSYTLRRVYTAVDLEARKFEKCCGDCLDEIQALSRTFMNLQTYAVNDLESAWLHNTIRSYHA